MNFTELLQTTSALAALAMLLMVSSQLKVYLKRL